MKKKILIGILSFVVCLTFGLGCYFIFGGKISLTTSAPQPPEQTQAEIYGYWTDYYTRPSGRGSSSDPYLIQSARDLAYLSATKSTFSGKYFKMTADVDMSAHYWSNNGQLFQGVFDGNNHNIIGVELNTSNSYIGLFYGCDGSGEIKNISNLSVKAGGVKIYTGGLAGSFAGTISNVNVNFTLNVGNLTITNAYIGGVYGKGAPTKIENCYAHVNIECGGTSDNAYIGGIAGYIQDPSKTVKVEKCNSYGSITYKGNNKTVLNLNVGGIIGRSDAKIAIDSCMNNVDITLTENYGCSNNGRISIGGILGELANSGTISEAGIAEGGHAEGSAEYYGEDNSITSCYNIGKIEASCGNKVNAGGICGISQSAILLRKCFNNASVKVTNGAGSVVGDGIGGIIGRVNRMNNSGKTNSKYISIITDCLNTAEIGASSYNGGVGGIAGSGAWIKINRCINREKISNNNNVGGIIGYINGGALTTVLGNCVNLGPINCNGSCGQIIGNSVSGIRIYNCYGLTNNGILFPAFKAINSNGGTKDSTTLSSSTFYRAGNWSAQNSIDIGGVSFSAGLLGWHVYKRTMPYFNMEWDQIQNTFYPIYINVSIGGVYLRANKESMYHDILKDSITTAQKQSLLEFLFSNINFGADKIAYKGGSSFSGWSILQESYINITCTDKAQVSAVTSSPQLYYDGNPADENYSKENPCFQPDLNIKNSSRSGNTYTYQFTPIFQRSSLYIYLTLDESIGGNEINGMPTFKPGMEFYLIKQDGSTPKNITSSVSTYLDTTKTTFLETPISEKDNITLKLFNENSYSITPKFGYAFYGISADGRYTNLNVVNNTTNIDSAGKPCRLNCDDGIGSRGNDGDNDFYLGTITGGFDFYLQDLTIFVKEVKYGVGITLNINGKMPIKILTPDSYKLYNTLNNEFDGFTHEDGYYYKVSYRDANGVELLKFCDFTNDTKLSVLGDDYSVLNYDNIWKAAISDIQANDINRDYLPVYVQKIASDTIISLVDYQDFYYRTGNHVTKELTTFGNGKRTETFVADTTTNKNGESINTLKFNIESGYDIKNKDIKVGITNYVGIADFNIDQSIQSWIFDDSAIADIYKVYLQSLTNNEFKNYVKQYESHKITLYTYYTLQEYTLNVEIDNDGATEGGVKLSTNENCGVDSYISGKYGDLDKYKDKDSENSYKIHYNSGIKIDLSGYLSGNYDKRLVGIYLDGKEADISDADLLTFYFTEDLVNAKQMLNLKIVFAKYDQVEPGKAPTPVRGVYNISTPQHLQWLSYQVANGEDFEGWLFRQTRDIDMSGIAFNPIGGKMLADGSRRVFKGTYDGNFYRITNLSFVGGNNQNAIAYMGLFGYVEDATIMNLMVEGSSLTGWANVGGVVGYAKNSTFTRVDNRNLAVSLNSQSNDLKYSGVKFIIDGEESYTNTVAVCDNFGGIVGYAENCSFLGCSNQAGVPNTAVGLIGRMNGGKLDQCFTKYGSIVPDEKIENATLTDYSDIKSNHQTNEDKWQNGKLKIFYWLNEIPKD